MPKCDFNKVAKQLYCNNTLAWVLSCNREFSCNFLSSLLKGVPQGSVLEAIWFNTFPNDLYFLVKDTDVCNFADDFHLMPVIFTLMSF